MSIPLSVIISTRNRVESLRRCVDALASVKTNHEWELIIVDNGSTDGTHQYLTSLPRQIGKARFTNIYYPKPGQAAALNAAIREANANILAFTDDDCYVAEDYIDAMISVFENRPDLGFIGGRILLYDPTDLKLTIDERNEFILFPPRTFLATGQVQGANMAFRRSTIERIGGFDEDFKIAADIDISAAALWAGISGAHDPTPVVYHHHKRKTKAAGNAAIRRYDYSRGEYFAKYLKRADSRSLYLKGWINHKMFLIRNVRNRQGNTFVARKIFREIFGGAIYLMRRVSFKFTAFFAS
jgi:GT2 family glycosyltransferase